MNNSDEKNKLNTDTAEKAAYDDDDDDDFDPNERMTPQASESFQIYFSNQTEKEIDLSKKYLHNSEAFCIGKALKTNTTLQVLNLECNHIRNYGAQCIALALKHNTTLRVLNISGNKIGNIGIKSFGEALGTNRTLQKLSLNNNHLFNIISTNEIMDYFMEHFKYNHVLTELNFSNNSIITNDSSLWMKTLGELLRNNSTMLKTCDWSNNYIQYGMRYLLEALNTNKTLREFNISGNGCQGLFPLDLSENTTLKVLNLSENRIDSSELSYLIQLLQFNLVTLIFSRNDIGEIGAQYIAEGLLTSSLVVLNLSYNNIGDVGATAIADTLRLNKSLEELNLRDNMIGDSGATSIAQALILNSSLVVLNLSYNNIGDVGATAISQTLILNSSLEVLNLSDNVINDDGNMALVNAFETNNTVSELHIYNVGGDPLNRLELVLKSNTTLQVLKLRPYINIHTVDPLGKLIYDLEEKCTSNFNKNMDAFFSPWNRTPKQSKIQRDAMITTFLCIQLLCIQNQLLFPARLVNMIFGFKTYRDWVELLDIC